MSFSNSSGYSLFDEKEKIIHSGYTNVKTKTHEVYFKNSLQIIHNSFKPLGRNPNCFSGWAECQLAWRVLSLIFYISLDCFRVCFSYATSKKSISPKSFFFPKMLS